MANVVQNASQDPHVEGKVKQEKVNWDDIGVDAFIKVCVEETLAKNRKGTHFSRVGWKNVVSKFYGLTKRNYTYKQLKNKWTAIRREWTQWTTLVSRETGLGWDPVMKTISASNEWWEAKTKDNPDLGRFRVYGLRNADMLDHLFKDNIVTGEGAWAPSQGFGLGEDAYVPDFGDENVYGMFDDDKEDDEDGNRADNVANGGANGGPINTEAAVPKNKKVKKGANKKPGAGVVVNNNLESILGAIANRNKGRPGCSIEEVMKVIDDIPDIVDDNELFLKVADIVTDRRNREMFVVLKNVNKQVMWLKNKKI